MLAADAELDAGSRLAAALDGDLDELADASLSIVTNGSTAKMPLRDVRAEERAASSREMPSVVCVRSLVPKEKNSAASAISAARSAARGSSIMVPTW